MEIQNVQDYYNKMATDYEASMFGWGYCMPEAIADALVKHGGLKIEAKVLDLGCGNGLSGQALYNRGVEDIAGVDFSRLVTLFVVCCSCCYFGYIIFAARCSNSVPKGRATQSCRRQISWSLSHLRMHPLTVCSQLPSQPT